MVDIPPMSMPPPPWMLHPRDDDPDEGENRTPTTPVGRPSRTLRAVQLVLIVAISLVIVCGAVIFYWSTQIPGFE